MAASNARTPDEYLASIDDPDRRALVERLRAFVHGALPRGYDHQMVYGMPGWVVPPGDSGPTYNGEPLGIVSIANQNQYVSVYLMGVYGNDEVKQEFERRWRATGKRFDMGKSCLRIRKEQDVAWDALAFAVGAVDPAALIARHRAVHGATGD